MLPVSRLGFSALAPAQFGSEAWDAVFYDTLCMSVLRCSHKCQFVFALIFVDFLKGFLGSFEVPKLKKTLKFKLGGEIRMQMSFWSSLDGFLPLGRVFWTPFVGPGAPQGLPGSPRARPKMSPNGVQEAFSEKPATLFCAHCGPFASQYPLGSTFL